MNLQAMNESKPPVEYEPEHEVSALSEELILFPPRKDEDLEMEGASSRPFCCL